MKLECTKLPALASPSIARTMGAASVILISSRASMLGLPSEKRILILISEKSAKSADAPASKGRNAAALGCVLADVEGQAPGMTP